MDGVTSLTDMARALAAGEVSCADEVAHSLSLAAEDEHNAWVELDTERAQARAARSDADRQAGRPSPMLHGVPVGIKDIIDVSGLPTRCGSAVLAETGAATEDAAVVASLRRAGAIPIGKTHTQEFALGPTGDGAAEGPARNPHDRQRIPGGSSSGSAIAVAKGQVPLGIGTDTGASIRVPAALSGVVGFKPRYGWHSMQGVFPLAESYDHLGILTRSVADAALAYRVLRGEETAAQSPRRDTSGVILGRPDDTYWQAQDPAITEAINRAAERLSASGVELRRVATQGIAEFSACYDPVLFGEAWATHRDWFTHDPQLYQEPTRLRLAKGQRLTAAEYVTAQRTRSRLAAQLTAQLEGVQALLLPTTPIRATPIGQRELPDGRPVAAALLSLTQPFNLLGWPAISVPLPPPDGGLPVGAQLVGVDMTGGQLLDLAQQLEAQV